jgi:spore coat polysaccharide biosynthesis predicted glycosyltransferase SpsG
MEYSNMIGEELGCDGIEIDYHSNPRPSHEEMQGQQYSIVGEKTINGVTYLDAYDEGIDSKDGESGLLNDYGCLHYKTPIILGVSEPRYSKKELAKLKEQDKKTYDIDGKTVTGYEATQMMRRLETAIRNEKSIKNMAQSGDSKKLVKDCNAKIKAYQAKYEEITNITGFAKETKRMSVPRKNN